MATTMNISRALAELKRIDDRVNRLIQESVFVGATIGKGDKQKMLTGNDNIVQAQAKIQSAFDRIQVEIETRAKIKAAIVQSNAVTQIILGGKSISVAEAIEMKKSISLKMNLKNTLQRQLIQVRSIIEQQNSKLEAQIEQNLAQIYGSDKSKLDAGTFEMVAAPQRAAKEAALLDPLKLEEKIEALSEEISQVDSELDYLLSTSNALTTITV
jgi:hypothetical protein